MFPEKDKDTYMVELNETVIGKAALRLINEKNIYEIELDVECKNNTALNLYKDCGFEELSVMNYYKYNV